MPIRSQGVCTRFFERRGYKVRQMGEVAYDRYDLHLALQWIRQHPGKFATLSAWRFLYFWAGPPEHPYELIVTTSYTLAGLVGLFFMKRFVGSIQFQIWVTVLASFPLMYYFVQYVSRYRTPIDWMLWFSAGLTFSLMFGKGAPRTSTLRTSSTKAVSLDSTTVESTQTTPS